jgi:hypothetical protein
MSRPDPLSALREGLTGELAEQEALYAALLERVGEQEDLSLESFEEEPVLLARRK